MVQHKSCNTSDLIARLLMSRSDFTPYILRVPILSSPPKRSLPNLASSNPPSRRQRYIETSRNRQVHAHCWALRQHDSAQPCLQRPSPERASTIKQNNTPDTLANTTKNAILLPAISVRSSLPGLLDRLPGQEPSFLCRLGLASTATLRWDRAGLIPTLCFIDVH